MQLSKEEQQQLDEMLWKGTPNSRVLQRARVLLLAHEGRYDQESETRRRCDGPARSVFPTGP